MLVFAHRGLHDRKVSENTILAFQRAAEAGVDGVEFDLRLSHDGEPVVVHDENLHRIAGDARRVRDLTASELQSIVLRGQGSIPTLNEVTATVPSPILLDIEIKDRETIEPLIRKLRTSASLRERAIISSFVAEDLERVRDELPDIRTLLLVRNWPLPFRGRPLWKKILGLQLWAIGFRCGALSQKRVQWLRRKGWCVAAWDEQPLKRDAKKIAKLRVDVAIVFQPKACVSRT